MNCSKPCPNGFLRARNGTTLMTSHEHITGIAFYDFLAMHVSTFIILTNKTYTLKIFQRTRIFFQYMYDF